MFTNVYKHIHTFTNVINFKNVTIVCYNCPYRVTNGVPAPPYAYGLTEQIHRERPSVRRRGFTLSATVNHPPPAAPERPASLLRVPYTGLRTCESAISHYVVLLQYFLYSPIFVSGSSAYLTQPIIYSLSHYYRQS